MLRSLYSGISGLRNHQIRMDVIGNNISNVNTIGYKSSRVIFQDIYSQTIKTASSAIETRGGTNPQQIGLGVAVAAIDVMHTQSSIQRSDNVLDLAIDGDGYFRVRGSRDDETQEFFTRAGNFYLDVEGDDGSDAYLVTASGMYVLSVDGEPINLPRNQYYSISISQDGTIYGIDENGELVEEGIAQISLAVFPNPSALEKVGNNLYAVSPNSGEPNVDNPPGEMGVGIIDSGGLEMSNVDLSGEFTDMIVTQRGFQANSRIITVSDTLLEELVNLKR